MSIKFKTYLTPSIPKEIFIFIAEFIEQECKIKVDLKFETKISGPKKGKMMKEDLAFMCCPPFYWLSQEYYDEIELVPWAPVFDDIRNGELPVYFSDILVHPDNRDIETLQDLNKHKWAYNDTKSLSGYFCIKNYHHKLKMICSGSHLNSIDMVKNKKADITCIDSNALLFLDHGLKKIGTIGPHPVQPCVIKRDCIYKDEIFKAFSKLENKLNKYKIKNFRKINKNFYFYDEKLLNLF
jgi:ABC-type phosphate/phosphonate transport system substrate-binding protein